MSNEQKMENVRRKVQLLVDLEQGNDPDTEIALELIEEDLKQIAEDHRCEEWYHRHQALSKEEEMERAERLGNTGAAETAAHDKFDCERRAEIHRAAAEQVDNIIKALQEDTAEQEIA